MNPMEPSALRSSLHSTVVNFQLAKLLHRDDAVLLGREGINCPIQLASRSPTGRFPTRGAVF